MDKKEIEIKSWDIFISNGLSVIPTLLGRWHIFKTNGHIINIAIPDKEAGIRRKVIHCHSYRSETLEPLSYDIQEVKVEVIIPKKIVVPEDMLVKNNNQYELLSEQERNEIEAYTLEHKKIAEKAFLYWLRVLRWICDDYRIGENVVQSFRSGWATHLSEVNTNKDIWSAQQVIYVNGFSLIDENIWVNAQKLLASEAIPPIHIEHKHEAERLISYGDYRQAIINMAIACETFLRTFISNRLPSNLNQNVINYIEKANINEYHRKFFPSMLDASVYTDYESIKSDINGLFELRNRIMHHGLSEQIDETIMNKYMVATEKLLMNNWT
jgi:hypothetical protein